MSGMDDQGNALTHAQGGSLPALSEETVNKLIAQQAGELELRHKEIDLRAMELRTNSAQAEKIIGAQERDREAERTHVRKTNRDRYYFFGIIALAVATLIGFGMYLGKDQLIEDVVKVLVGGLGGYGIGRLKNKSKSSEDDSEE